MKNTENSQAIVTQTKKYFSKTIKYIYFNKLTIKQWCMYFNILKAALETNTPTENLLNFAEVLDLATVMFIFDNDTESINYSKMKIELKLIIERLKEPKIVIDDKKLILTPIKNTIKKES